MHYLSVWCWNTVQPNCWWLFLMCQSQLLYKTFQRSQWQVFSVKVESSYLGHLTNITPGFLRKLGGRRGRSTTYTLHREERTFPNFWRKSSSARAKASSSMYTAGLLAMRKYCTFLGLQPITYWSQPQTAAVDLPTPALQWTYTVCPFSSSACRRQTAWGSIWTRPGIERAQHIHVSKETPSPLMITPPAPPEITGPCWERQGYESLWQSFALQGKVRQHQNLLIIKWKECFGGNGSALKSHSFLLLFWVNFSTGANSSSKKR